MGPFIRIGLRYATMPLLYFGIINPDEAADIISEPELVQYISLGLGMIAPTIAEGWYYLARKLGWEK